MNFLEPRHISDAELAKPSLLDENNYRKVKGSVYQLQCWTGDETDLDGLSIKELLSLQKKREKNI